jgi:UDP-N-acetylglucosamine acyltransferase
MIHPTAIIEEGAVLGAGCTIHAHAIVRRHAVLGDGVVIHPFAVVGGDPQDLSFDPARETGVRIGDRTVLREYVTVNRATQANSATVVGSDCFLMTGSHVAHDCRLGDRVILANAVLLAGHVQIGDRAFVGGGAAVHQFVRIGEGAMVSGLARVARDLPPFVMAAERDEVVGLNVVGIRRRGLPRETVAELRRAYHEAFRPTGNLRALAAEALASGSYTSVEARAFLEFLQGGRRGFARRRRGTSAGEAAD